MIKILHYVSVMDRGGQETFIMNVYRNIDKTKVQFDFLCSINIKGDYDDEIKELGGKIIYLDINRSGGKITKYIKSYKNTVTFLKKYANDYEIVHLHNYHAFSSYLDVKALKKAGFKHIVLHSHNTSAPRIKLHNIFKPLLSRDKNIVRFACSNSAGKWLHGNKSFTVIYNGIDTNKFKYDENERVNLRKELGLENNFVIGMVGRFNYQKNHMFALEVFKKCIETNPNARLVLVGKGESGNDIKQKIAALGLGDKVIMLGTRDDVEKLMSAFDVLLMPSIFEGLPVVLVEAQYNGLNCVVSSVICREVVVSDLLHFVDLEDSLDKWAKVLLSCPKHSVANIDNENFNIINVAKDLEEKYLDIASK